MGKMETAREIAKRMDERAEERAKLEKALDKACKVIAVFGAGFADLKVTELLEDNQYEDDERSRSEYWKRYFLEGGE